MPRSSPRWARRVIITAAAALALAAAFATSATAASSSKQSYIVVLRAHANSNDVAAEHSRRYGAEVDHVYRFALRGYSARMSESAAEHVRNDSRVRFVESDGVMTAAVTQSGATWGLDRIDQRNLPLSTTYTYTNTGAGVKAYIIDTGIRITHQDFGGRASYGYDAVDGSLPADDCNGHGTHVSGTVGGATYGVAKGISLVAVRVLGCSGSGSTSGVIAGVDWVTGNHQAGQPAVANMSLGGGVNSALDTAVRNSIADGVAYSLSAGNGNILGFAINACNQSPGRVAEAMTISATDRNDRKASWANYGSCVDWFAPGVSITSAWASSDTSTNTISGTSMAAPHTAGVAALYLQSNPSASPASVRTALYNLTTKGIVTSSNTANNHLLYTNL